MADPLSLLRQYSINKRDITEKNGMICFGEYCWAKNVKTNYLIYSSSRDGPNKSYYTLECLVYFLRNISLQHPTYVKQAAGLDIPVVQRPDRKDLLAYLSGETSHSTSIDKSAPIELPKSTSQLYKEAQAAAGQSSFSGSSGSGSIIPGFASASDRHDDEYNLHGGKRARLDNSEMEKVRQQFAARLDAPKIKMGTSAAVDAALGLGDASGMTSITDSMSIEQIAALKAKRLAKKRSTIIDNIDGENDIEGGQIGLGSNSAVHSVLLQYDQNFTKQIQEKERTWRNRTNVLQSVGKNFARTIVPMLQTIKIREEGGASARKPGSGPPGLVRPGPAGALPGSVLPGPASAALGGLPGGPGAPPGLPGAAGGIGAPQQYNRYDQERFTKNDAPIGFRIDTTSTYHGLTLKSVTDGSAQPKAPLANANAQNGGTNGASATGSGSHHHHHPSGTAHHHHSSSKPQKRVSRTPIIIIPATNTSLITMFNAKAILQDLKYIDTKSCDQRRENEVLIQRRKPDNSTVPYRIVDSPLKLNHDDWNRVVAVFVQGPAWQFKGWPWDGNPVEIFARIKAFHLKFDEMKLDNNVAKWSVEIIELSRSKRHLDRANLLKFWSQLDGHIAKHKHNCVRY